ncbi:MAG: carbohydrate ABC transporter permease, partial [Halanaerobiales bacterium]
MLKNLHEFIFNSRFTLYIMLLPAILMVLAFAIYPLFYNFSLSIQEVNVNTLLSDTRPFAGLANYISVFHHEEFLTILKNTIIFTVFSVFFQFILGLAFALYFNQDFPFHEPLRGLLLIGWVIPPAVIGTIWRWLLNDDIGVINYLLSLVGIGSVPWLVDTNIAIISVLIANIWFAIPFNMILMTSGLVSIPQQVHDAAAIDGTTYLKKLWYIILPIIKPNIYATIILDLIYTFRSFPLIWNMTKGGPVNATTVLPVWSYIHSFNYFEFGIGTAIAVII